MLLSEIPRLPKNTKWRFVRSFVASLLVYCVVLAGVFTSHGGVFWRVGCLLAISFAVYHLVFVWLVNWRALLKSPAVCVLLPSAIVCYEYLRHCLVYFYDGSGFTLLVLGQFVPSAFGLQLASWGGIWLLSFWCGFLIALMWLTIDRNRRCRTRVACGWLLTGLLAAFWISDSLASAVEGRSVATVVAVPLPVSQDSVAVVTSFVNDCRLAGVPTVLAPETMLNLRMDRDTLLFDRPNDLAWLEISRQANCVVLVGSWIQVPGREDRINAIVQIRDGEVVGARSKLRLAPFVESRPLGTQWLENARWIPDVHIRNAMSPSDAQQWLGGFGRPENVQASVCYDIFFSSASIVDLQPTDAFLACSLDETHDRSGVFQALSMMHSRIRAVEARRSLVRCSLGGTTAAIDPWGCRIDPKATRLGLVAYDIPISQTASVYSAAGDWIVWPSLGLVGGWLLFRRFCCHRIEDHGDATT